jgi:1-acyl-sn-glycerol-3-phosphate acyltransferase
VRYTIFDTPILSSILVGVALVLLKLIGWRKEGELPNAPKFVIIGAHHTSNWDFPMAMVFAFAYRTKICFLAKDSLFRWPFGALFRWFGGIPIERSHAHGVVAERIRAFNESERLVMVIAPEGTRAKVRVWKKGFYYIAQGANVPIQLAFLDYKRKVGGMGPLITPTGDIEADMARIRDFYATVTPKRPERADVPSV